MTNKFGELHELKDGFDGFDKLEYDVVKMNTKQLTSCSFV